MPRKRVLRALIILRLLIATVKIASAGEECSTLTAADVQKITGTQVHNVLRESEAGGARISLRAMVTCTLASAS
jgi:hypothetical protein